MRNKSNLHMLICVYACLSAAICTFAHIISVQVLFGGILAEALSRGLYVESLGW